MAVAAAAFAAVVADSGAASATPPAGAQGLVDPPASIDVTGPAPLDGCPANPPISGNTFSWQQRSWPASGSVWALPGDTVTLRSSCVACLPTSDAGGANPRWTRYDFPNSAQMEWIADGVPAPQPIQRIGDPIYATSTYTVTGIDATNDTWSVRQSPGLFAVTTTTWGGRSNRMTVDCNETSFEVRAFNPEVTVTKQACIPGSPCDPTDDADWSDTTQEYALGQQVTWRVLARNTGNVTIENARVESDELASSELTGLDGTTGLCEGEPLTNLGDPSLGSTLNAPGGGPDTETGYATCTTTLPATPAEAGAAGGTLTNTAQVIGEAVDPTDDGSIATRFDGAIEYRSNAGSAEVQVVSPHLQLTKEVCVEVDADGACTDWQDADTDATSPGHGLPVVPAGTQAQWRITATNDGTADLTDVELSRDDLSGAATEAGYAPCIDATFSGGGSLAPGDSATLTCSGPTIDDTGTPLVNTAQAVATYDGSAVESDPDDAQVIGAAMGIEASVWVCPAGRTCAASDFVSPTQPGPWVKSATITEHRNVTWLIAATNTGDVDFQNVSLASDELAAHGQVTRTAEAAACVAASTSATIPLAVGESTPLATCTSDDVLVAESPLVNTGKVIAVPVRIGNLHVDSQVDSAEVTVTAGSGGGNGSGGGGGAATTGPTAGSSGDGPLARTGSDALAIGLAAACLVAVGGGIAYAARARRSA